MSQNAKLAVVFEKDRLRLRRIAHRMLGDWDQAEDAVQESWLKAINVPSDELRNASAWFTTITTRVCLDRLRLRKRRGTMIELDDPNTEIDLVSDHSPENARLTADTIGVALLVILERLRPLERVAFVLHDVFALPFDEIARLIDRSPEAARQLANRARRRIRGPVDLAGTTRAQHRQLADAFLIAARGGDMATLLNLLDPDVVFTSDSVAARMGPGARVVGSEQVARFFSGRAAAAHVAIVDGNVGIIVAPHDTLLLVVLPRFENGRITHLHAVAAPDALGRFDVTLADGETPNPMACQRPTS